MSHSISETAKLCLIRSIVFWCFFFNDFKAVNKTRETKDGFTVLCKYCHCFLFSSHNNNARSRNQMNFTISNILTHKSVKTILFFSTTIVYTMMCSKQNLYSYIFNRVFHTRIWGLDEDNQMGKEKIIIFKCLINIKVD